MGFSQSVLGEKLGITKQAVSKLEQSEKIDDKRIKEVADALEVTKEGLKRFNDEKVINNTINFNEGCEVKTDNVIANVENFHHVSVEKLAKVFEELLKMDRETFKKATSGNSGSGKK